MKFFADQQKLCPGVSEQVSKLLQCGRFGLCSSSAKLSSVSGGSSGTLENAISNDRFYVELSIAGHSVKWFVIMNGDFPNDPPDFIFEEEDFHPNPKHLSHLRGWDGTNASSLTHLLQQLLQEYQTYQVSVISKHERLLTEYEQCKYLRPEIHANQNKNGLATTTNFMLSVPVNFEQLPDILLKAHPGHYSAMLLVTFNSPGKAGKVTPQLFLSPALESIFGSSSDYKIPPFKSCSLHEYFQLVQTLLENRVKAISSCFEARQQYVDEVCRVFSRCVLNSNKSDRYDVSLLLEWHNFFFVVNITLPPFFPEKPPIIEFQSMYHVTKKDESVPFTMNFDEPAHSPRWSIAEIVDRNRTFILEHISDFQKKSVTIGTVFEI